MEMKKLTFFLILIKTISVGAIEIWNPPGQKLYGSVHPMINENLPYDRVYNRQIFKETKKASLDKESKLLEKITSKQKLIGKLGKVKYAMMNGNLERAKVELLKIKEKDAFANVIKKRYQAIIYFLQGQYDKSLGLISTQEFNDEGLFAKTCILRVLNMVILDDHIKLNETWRKCRNLVRHTERTESIWFDNLVKLRANKKNYIAKSKIKQLQGLGYNELFIKLYLKLSLYMNQEDTILKFIEELPGEFFLDDEIREIMGHLYYRRGKLGTAFDFLEDLKTVNAENIKGNIYLADQKYELAYAQFKLALQQKNDSYNAIERALPLAWLLEQWNDGVDFSKRMYRTNENKNKKLAILTAFYLRLGRYEEAMENLKELTVYSKYSQPYEVNQLYAFTALVLGDLDKMKIYSSFACKKLDAINCWLLLQASTWDDFSKTLKRKEAVTTDAVELLYNLKSTVYDAPIDEDQFIDQHDIEELDDKLIRINSES